ncbi:hypothetical protein V5O48_019210 [Marasmius crinis-equi]|uniref:C2 domain-containing protein n=1 Tax=Marasmius crinis-equi TaxID=585013 RepID=A0ABR3EJ41_9AGAR
MSTATSTSTTPAPATTVPAALPTDKPTPTPAELTSEPLSLSFLSMKDQRAYEHDRQRTRHTRDFAQMKARKEFLSLRRVIPSYFTRGSEKEKDKVVTGWDAEDDCPSEPPAINSNAISPKSPSVAVGDLIVNVSVRKPKTRKGARGSYITVALFLSFLGDIELRRSDADFEFVPHVRSVIALDDIVQVRDVQAVDEPWEHVTLGLGDDEKAALSYADVVAGTA